jgi:nucleotide-binding universal stress UspA family protein
MVLSPKRILWPTDFSPLSLQGARYARGFRDHFGSELHVVHVIAPPLTPDLAVALPTEVPVTYSEPELVEACRARLAELIADQFGGTGGVVTDVFFGHPWSAICKYAEQSEIELIVVATHGRTGLRHVLIGSTAERIVQHAPCPVLVVKSPETDFLVE